MWVTAPTPVRRGRILVRDKRSHTGNHMMITHTLETGWKRFLDRFRKLWAVPPQHNPVHQPLEHEVTKSKPSEDWPPVSQR
jgi:hypothetical protein